MKSTDSAIIATDSATVASIGDGRIDAGSRVTLHFSLTLGSGDEVDSTRGREPAVFTMGDGRLLPGFERALLGLGVGDEVTVGRG